MPKVAYQGSVGAFSQLAAESRIAGARATGFADFDGVVRAVRSGKADLGLVPVWNSTIGEIETSRAALHSATDLEEVDRFEFPICLCLLALPGTAVRTIRSVESHPEALKQCVGFLATHRLTPKVADDTAESARRISLDRNYTRAAVASERAAEHHGLEVLYRDIADARDNRTAFVVIAPGAAR
ncbi:MAG TPA: prephenate dehydratase domain-containing protein [Gemmatimonadales bacterium]